MIRPAASDTLETAGHSARERRGEIRCLLCPPRAVHENTAGTAPHWEEEKVRLTIASKGSPFPHLDVPAVVWCENGIEQSVRGDVDSMSFGEAYEGSVEGFDLERAVVNEVEIH